MLHRSRQYRVHRPALALAQLPKDQTAKKRPLIFLRGQSALVLSLLGELFASAILNRYLDKLWVVGKPLGLGFTSQRFLSILFDKVIDKWLTRFPDVVRITLWGYSCDCFFMAYSP
jgi:hypothetical protein